MVAFDSANTTGLRETVFFTFSLALYMERKQRLARLGRKDLRPLQWKQRPQVIWGVKRVSLLRVTRTEPLFQATVYAVMCFKAASPLRLPYFFLLDILVHCCLHAKTPSIAFLRASGVAAVLPSENHCDNTHSFAFHMWLMIQLIFALLVLYQLLQLHPS